MRRTGTYMIGLSFFVSLAVVISFARASAATVGSPFPDLKIPHHKAGVLTRAALKGQVTIVNFWATWCAACKVEIVEMEDEFRPFLGERDFKLAFVSLDKDPAKAVAWFSSRLKEPKRLLEYLYLDSDFSAAESLGVDAFPMTFVIGRDGKIKFVQRGFRAGDGSTKRLARLSQQLLKKQP